MLKGVDRAAAHTGKPVALIIDEFQRVVSTSETAQQEFRAAVQTHRHIGYIFAGSATRLLTDMTTKEKQPFYRLGETLFIGPIPRPDFAEFLVRSFSRGHIKLDAGAITAILDEAEDVPYNVQLLAHGCWEACRETVSEKTGRGAKSLTPELVRRMHEVLARRNDPLYTQLWNERSSAQQRALLAVRREHGQGLKSSEVVARYSMPVPTMQKALSVLDARGLTRREGDRANLRHYVEDPLFGKWLDLTIPK